MKINFLSAILFISTLLISCEDKLNEFEQELYNQVIGRWEMVSYTSRQVCFRGNCEIHFHISDSLLLPNDYVEVINFKDDGFFVKEYHSGDTEQHRWFIHQNSLWIEYYWYAQSNKTEIYKLTKTELHFKILHSRDENLFVIYELKR